MIRLTDTKGFVATDKARATHYFEYAPETVVDLDHEWCDSAVRTLELSPAVASAIREFADREQLDGDLVYNFWEAWGEDVPGVVEIGDAIRQAAPRLTREIPSERVYLRADIIVTPCETDDNSRSWGLGD